MGHAVAPALLLVKAAIVIDGFEIVSGRGHQPGPLLVAEERLEAVDPGNLREDERGERLAEAVGVRIIKPFDQRLADSQHRLPVKLTAAQQRRKAFIADLVAQIRVCFSQARHQFHGEPPRLIGVGKAEAVRAQLEQRGFVEAERRAGLPGQRRT